MLSNRVLIPIYRSVVLFLLTANLQADTRVFFSPKGGCTNEVITHINNAQKTIDIAIYSFTSEPIAHALVRVEDRGVQIRILMDKQQAKGRHSKATFLFNNGIPVTLDRHSGCMHNKIAVIDSAVVLTGSFNWSKNAEERNEENLLVIDDLEIVNIYQKRLDYLWKYNKGIRKMATKLFQNYPNPFIGSTWIKYRLAEDSDVSISIYNLLGRKIVSLVSDNRNAGYHSIRWNGRDKSGKKVVSGIYFYRLCVRDGYTATPQKRDLHFVSTRKMYLVK